MFADTLAAARPQPFLASADLSPRALFVYFDALARGASEADAERAARAVATRPAVAARVYFDLAWRSIPQGRERARALVAAWFERHPDAGHFFTDDVCVCVAVRAADATRFVQDIAALDRLGGEPTALARIDAHGPVSSTAFGRHAAAGFVGLRAA